MSAHLLIWMVVAGTVVADVVLLAAQGMRVSEVWWAMSGTMLLYGLSIMYWRRAPSLACMSDAGAQMVAFSHAGSVLCYAALAASPFPMADAQLSRADSACGFDWMAWYRFVDTPPIFTLLLPSQIPAFRCRFLA
jgi:hypothetical protein